jgi:hypothetical protein
MATRHGRSTWSSEVTMNRRTLVLAVCGLAAVGLAAVAVPFAQSWRLNDTAKAGQLAVDLSAVPVGGFTTIERPIERIYILRPSSDHVSVLSVQLIRGEVYLPDSSRYNLMGPCHRFEPDNDHGQLAPGGYFHCLDRGAETYFFGSSRWTFDGQAVKPVRNADRDLVPVPFERSGLILTLRRSK